MHPKKILHVVSTADFIDHFLYDNIIYCNKGNFVVTVACTPDELLFDLAKSGGFSVASVRINRSYTPWADLVAVRKLRKLIRKNKFDIVIGHTPKGSLLAMIAAKLEKVRVRIYYRHGILYQTASGFKMSILKELERLTARCATGVINVSKSVENFAIKNRLNAYEKNIFLGTHGSCGAFDPHSFCKKSISPLKIRELKNLFSINSKDIVIGYFGRMVNDKGINELIVAWEEVTNKFNNVKLLLAGEFEERDGLPQKTRDKIKTDSTIIFLDYYKEIKVLYALLDIFILPSYREGLPTVALEASAMEIPVITTRATGCIDAIINNVTGLFCTHNSQNIAKKITFYIEQPEVRKIHGQNGRNFVLTHFDQRVIWEEFVKKVLNI
ncbi:glycosyltransferase family 4 protein [Arachidicoccus terrestris]|uniref:glycosyltransferase family 4 protein n=1 Tax=Arachidicoccus terrestris TaxID=2875539 RepID=UPI001CC556C9|nr:glycosyltransferase family 4 protein [Arachidicoccus terrestris]UAY55455.1 glycosyltransferase family 4 protein [Arachidicoccus terrestris]